MKFYAFDGTTLLLDGKEITGFTESDDCISAARLEDSFGHIMTNRGKMTVYKRASKAGELLIKLDQTHDDNDWLSKRMVAAENGVFVPIPMMFKDNFGSDLFTGNKGYLRRPADATRGTTPGEQVWSLVIERFDMLHGGNDEV